MNCNVSCKADVSDSAENGRIGTAQTEIKVTYTCRGLRERSRSVAAFKFPLYFYIPC